MRPAGRPGGRLPLDGGDATLIREALGAAWAARAFAGLLADSPWRTASVRMFGRELPSPRLTAWYGERAYRYSGLTWAPRPWTGELSAIRAHIEALCDSRFNGALLNLYRDGRDSMGWHSDDEAELGPAPTIASLSLGAPRRFVFRRRADPKTRRALELPHDSLLIMRGGTQAHWQHALPKTARPAAPRINLTFRWIGA